MRNLLDDLEIWLFLHDEDKNKRKKYDHEKEQM
jgi:hypothetical protein